MPADDNDRSRSQGSHALPAAAVKVCAAVAFVVCSLALASCGGSDAPSRAVDRSGAAQHGSDRPGDGAPAGATRAPGTITPPRRISSRKPTTFVGGPLLFRAPYPRYPRGTTFTYVLVFKLNRDPYRNFGIENAERRGYYEAGGVGFSTEGVLASPGRHCFVTYVSIEIPDPAILPLRRLRIGHLVRVKAQPLGTRPRGREFVFDVPLLRAGRGVADEVSLRRLRRIGCGQPRL